MLRIALFCQAVQQCHEGEVVHFIQGKCQNHLRLHWHCWSFCWNQSTETNDIVNIKLIKFFCDTEQYNNTHLTAVFQDNPGELVPECLHSGSDWS